MNITRKIIRVIAFLLAVTSLASLSGAALTSVDYNNTPVQDSFRVLVTPTGVEGHCGEEVTITVAYKSETFELCEDDERPSEEQRADPIFSEGYEFEFPKGQIAAGETFDICIESSDRFSVCETLTNWP